MIEESAVVSEVGEGFVWIEPRYPTGCYACSANTACGNAMLAKTLGRRRRRMRVSARIPLQIGDEVVIGISEHALLWGSVAMYIAPLFGFFLGTVLGDWTVPENEIWVILCGLAGLSAGFAWVRRLTRRRGYNIRFQPVVLRRLVPTNTMPNEL